MKKLSVLLLVVVASAMAACTYQKTNTIKQADVREGDEWVYGVHPDSGAYQLKKTYTADPELQKKADAIREKLYGDKSA